MVGVAGRSCFGSGGSMGDYTAGGDNSVQHVWDATRTHRRITNVMSIMFWQLYILKVSQMAPITI
jgi:hypothetical protein